MKQLVALVLSLGIGLPSEARAHSQTNRTSVSSEDWVRIQTLPVGSMVRVTLVAGAELAGRLVSIQGDELVLRDNQVTKGTFINRPGASLDLLTFQRIDIARLRPPTRGPSGAQWGLIAGAIAGVIVLVNLLNCFGCH